MRRSSTPRTNSINSAKSSKGSVVSAPAPGGTPTGSRPGSSDSRQGPPQQWRNTFGGDRGGHISGDISPASKLSYHSGQNDQQAPSPLREQPSKTSVRTGSSGTSVYTVASSNNGLTGLNHPAQPRRETADERRRAEDAQRRRERDASRERLERSTLEAQMINATQDPDHAWFIQEADRVSKERAEDRGKRVRPEERRRR